MVFDAISSCEEALFVMGTSEGGAIMQKLLESQQLVDHMKKFGHRIALISPAYAVGDSAIVDDPFYSRAKLNPDKWWVSDQMLIYSNQISMHVVNTDIGFAGLQGMKRNTNGVDMSNYNGLLEGAIAYGESLTWHFFSGAPHSLPTCNVRRGAEVDGGLYNGIDCEGYYSGHHNIASIATLTQLFRTFVEEKFWSTSDEIEAISKAAYVDSGGGLRPTIDEVFASARQIELNEAKKWAAVKVDSEEDDLLIKFRIAKWVQQQQETENCNAYVEEQRAAQRI